MLSLQGRKCPPLFHHDARQFPHIRSLCVHYEEGNDPVNCHHRKVAEARHRDFFVQADASVQAEDQESRHSSEKKGKVRVFEANVDLHFEDLEAAVQVKGSLLDDRGKVLVHQGKVSGRERESCKQTDRQTDY